MLVSILFRTFSSATVIRCAKDFNKSKLVTMYFFVVETFLISFSVTSLHLVVRYAFEQFFLRLSFLVFSF